MHYSLEGVTITLHTYFFTVASSSILGVDGYRHTAVLTLQRAQFTPFLYVISI